MFLPALLRIAFLLQSKLPLGAPSRVGCNDERDTSPLKKQLFSIMWIRSLEWKKKKNVIVGSISTQRHREKILGDESPPRYPLKPSTVVCQRNHSGWLTDPTCEANRYCQVDICPDLLEPSDGAGCCFFSSFFPPSQFLPKYTSELSCPGNVSSWKCSKAQWQREDEGGMS